MRIAYVPRITGTRVTELRVTELRVTELPTGLRMVFGGRVPEPPAPASGQPTRRELPEADAEQPSR